MRRKSKKIFSLLVLLILLAGIGFGIYFGITHKSTNNIYTVSQGERQTAKEQNSTKSVESNNDLQFFPELREEKYYKYIKIKDDKAVFDKEVVLAIYKDVAKNKLFVNGVLKYKYKFINSDTKLVISFIWVTSNNEEKYHTYTLDITQPDHSEEPLLGDM